MKFSDLVAQGREPYLMVGHRWYSHRALGKNVCGRCGLVALNNARTHWAIQKGCNNDDHPDYDKVIRGVK